MKRKRKRDPKVLSTSDSVSGRESLCYDGYDTHISHKYYSTRNQI